MWVGLMNTEVLELTSDLDLWGVPLDDHVLGVWDDATLLASLEDDSLGLLTVWQPTLNEHLLWLGWGRWETLNDDLTGWWWDGLAWDGDLFAWEGLWWLWWSLTDGEWLWGWGSWALLSHDEWWGWSVLLVGLYKK